jgi:hypothetical protein
MAAHYKLVVHSNDGHTVISHHSSLDRLRSTLDTSRGWADYGGYRAFRCEEFRVDTPIHHSMISEDGRLNRFLKRALACLLWK